MLGAIAGDVIGSVFETQDCKTTDFRLFEHASRFTDDSVLTVAVADAILGREYHPARLIDNYKARRLYARKIKLYGKRFPNAGYGQMFAQWLRSDSLRGYGSYGNGSAMRVSPIGFAFDNLEDVLREAKLSAVVTHSHRQGVRGAQAIASAVFLAWKEESKQSIKAFVEKQFRYDLSQTLDEIRPNYKFDSSCDGSVPQAIIAFLESNDYEDAVRKAVSLGGDSDTIACMAGGIAEAYYKALPSQIIGQVRILLAQELKRVIDQFGERYQLTHWWQ